VRPNEFVTSADHSRVVDALADVLAEVTGRRDGQNGDRLARVGEPVGGVWQRYRVGTDNDDADLDVVRLVRGLRGRGIAAQPNHVYFTTTITFAPNTFAPNTFAPNTFAPNTFAPNTFA